jgi:hypothetical protein
LKSGDPRFRLARSDNISSLKERHGYKMASSTNSYHTQIMNQQAQALDALQKVVKLEEGIDSHQPNGRSNGQVVPANQNEVGVKCIFTAVYSALIAFLRR